MWKTTPNTAKSCVTRLMALSMRPSLPVVGRRDNQAGPFKDSEVEDAAAGWVADRRPQLVIDVGSHHVRTPLVTVRSG